MARLGRLLTTWAAAAVVAANAGCAAFGDRSADGNGAASHGGADDSRAGGSGGGGNGSGASGGDGGERHRDGRANYAFDIDAPAALVPLIRDNTLLGRWQYRDDYDSGQRPLFVRRAPDEVRQVLATEGYFEPTVEITESLFKVTMKVWPGPRFTVNQVELTFEGDITEPAYASRRAALEKSWPLHEGSFFTQQLWTTSKRDVITNLRNNGFPRARIVDSRAAVDLEKTAVALSVKVDSGPLMRIGKVSFEGLQRYSEAVLTPLEGFHAGQVYTLQALLDFQDRLRETQWFRSVTVMPDLTQLEEHPDQREVNIRVVVVENQAERLTLGIGYSTDRGVRGQIGWTDRNWLGRAWQFDSKVLIDQVAYTGYVGIRTPTEAGGHYWSGGLNVERTDIQNTINQTGNLFIGRGRQLGPIEYYGSLTYQADRQWTENFDGSKDYLSRHALVPSYTWTVRRLDSRLYPTRGYTFNYQLSGAFDNVMSSTTFFRGYVRAMRFIPMKPGTPLAGGVVMLVAEGGGVFPGTLDGVPSQNLFRAGGAQSIRGYAYQSIGIQRGLSVVGGRFLAVGTIEYQHPIVPNIAGAVFYDRGGVSDIWRDMKTVAGYGVGVRFRTPVGPINVDAAYGQADRRVRMHLSIGYSF